MTIRDIGTFKEWKTAAQFLILLSEVIGTTGHTFKLTSGD